MSGEGGCRLRILLLAGDVRSNLGDRAIRAALCDMLRAMAPEAELHALSRTPERDRREFGVRILGRTPFALLRHAASLRGFSFALWGGGQLLQDDSSRVKNVYWALLLFWVRRVLRLPLAGVSLGVGPLQTGWGRWWASAALSHVDVLLARDRRSADEARGLTAGRRMVLEAPDLAWFLPAAGRAERDRHLAAVEASEPRAGELVVGIALRRWFHLRGSWLPHGWAAGRRGDAEDPRMEAVLDHLAEALRTWAAGRPVRLLFFPMASGGSERDAAFSRRVGESAGLPFHVLRLEAGAAMAAALTGRCDLFVSMRMHSALLAMAQGVPAITLYHVPKVRDLAEGLGLSGQTLPIEAVAGPGGARVLCDLLAETERRRDELVQTLARAAAQRPQGAAIYRETLQRMMEVGRERARREAAVPRRPETLRG